MPDQESARLTASASRSGAVCAPLDGHGGAARLTGCLGDIEWLSSEAPIGYPEAVALMEERIAAISASCSPEAIWLLQHPPLYTAGTSARPSELLDSGGLPVFPSGRGGRFTYHGPGQRVAYVMLDLRRRGCDIRAFVHGLETWLITALASLGVAARPSPVNVGVWVDHPSGREAKIAAIGVRVRRWVSYHGIALNVDPDLKRYRGIVPCGLEGYSVTSLADLGCEVDLAVVDRALRDAFPQPFPPA